MFHSDIVAISLPYTIWMYAECDNQVLAAWSQSGELHIVPILYTIGDGDFNIVCAGVCAHGHYSGTGRGHILCGYPQCHPGMAARLWLLKFGSEHVEDLIEVKILMESSRAMWHLRSRIVVSRSLLFVA